MTLPHFDHSYTPDKGHKFLKQLAKSGFKLDPRVVEHPGHAFCRFIPISKYFYLEFVNVKKGNIYTTPGVSFGIKGNLFRFYKKMKMPKTIEVMFEHKNYEWKQNSIDRLPGWNFVFFKNTGIRSYFPWFTENEKIEQRRTRKDLVHLNSVWGLYGVEIAVNKDGDRLYKSLFGKNLGSNVKLKCGSRVFFKQKKWNRFSKIILKCKNFEKAEKMLKPDFISVFDGRKAMVLKNPNKRGWNLYIVEC